MVIRHVTGNEGNGGNGGNWDILGQVTTWLGGDRVWPAYQCPFRPLATRLVLLSYDGTGNQIVNRLPPARLLYAVLHASVVRTPYSTPHLLRTLCLQPVTAWLVPYMICWDLYGVRSTPSCCDLAECLYGVPTLYVLRAVIAMWATLKHVRHGVTSRHHSGQRSAPIRRWICPQPDNRTLTMLPVL